ncbi:GNAT family N-acetyltransferase [Acinetobacter larvae]|uniref:GNAT family N-acetyltransferase n=2 Tax=Acinetobacter larvae TaxID=1789224 RepID=A0A1B2M4B0_9GAMM|nr:GNAT family N-acetyltransferase [Acinetobacter larvae]
MFHHNDFIIRPAQATDLTAIQQIINTEIATGTANWGTISKSMAQLEQWWQHLQQHNFPLLVAQHKEHQTIAGYADYDHFRSLSGYKQSVEHSVFIHPDYNRRGLGKALLTALLYEAQQHDIKVMVAAIDQENVASIRLHQQLGFVQTGLMPKVGQKFGQWRDLVLMQYTFEDVNPL